MKNLEQGARSCAPAPANRPFPYGRGSDRWRPIAHGDLAGAARRRPARGRRRPAFILPVILVILALLALMAASFTFHVQADSSAGGSMAERLQTRMAAEAGVQRVMYLLRAERDNIDAWYDNPELFDQALLWRPNVAIENIGKRELRTAQGAPEGLAYRFSIVADNPFDDELAIRYGITDEASKLNINTASEEQLLRLITPFVPEGREPRELVEALLDWRDGDDEPREFGAESAYYQALPVPYRAKNGQFATVEELLLVRGFDGRVLYGEDYDRNGLLTPNEDDGEVSFPFDNGDGKLNRGLLPYITVYTHEFNVANDNQPRINLFAEANQIRPKLEEVFDNPAIVDYLLGATKREGTERIRSLADYLESHVINNTRTDSPIRGRDAALLFDKCTLEATPERYGLINVVTAPARVLECITGLPPEAVPLILQKRAGLTPPIKGTTAWLATEKIVTPEQYALIQNQITARARQFTIESIGFADHCGVFTRLQVIVDMRGPLAQVVYHRDLTKLGMAYPLRGREGERDLVIRNR